MLEARKVTVIPLAGRFWAYGESDGYIWSLSEAGFSDLSEALEVAERWACPVTVRIDGPGNQSGEAPTSGRG